MDTLTHAIVGATLARATVGNTVEEDAMPTRVRVWIGGLAAAFPDIDFVTVFINPLTFISDWHRAETHSLVMLPVWALSLGFVSAHFLKRRQHWHVLALICGISILSHIFTDLITSWGTAIFAPLSDYRGRWAITFIIDPYFTAIILTGLIFALTRNSRLVAQAAVAALLAYIGFQTMLKYQARQIGEQYVRENKLSSASVHTMPQPFSPFNWKIIVTTGEIYYLANVDLIGSKNKPLPDKRDTSFLHSIYYYRPKQQLDWQKYSRYGTSDDAGLARRVWRQPRFKRYRDFAVYPAIHHIEKTGLQTCVWFMDLRFVLPQLATPFIYGMCNHTHDHEWRLFRLEHEHGKDSQPVS